jgi:hypothetical protein
MNEKYHDGLAMYSNKSMDDMIFVYYYSKVMEFGFWIIEKIYLLNLYDSDDSNVDLNLTSGWDTYLVLRIKQYVLKQPGDEFCICNRLSERLQSIFSKYTYDNDDGIRLQTLFKTMLVHKSTDKSDNDFISIYIPIGEMEFRDEQLIVDEVTKSDLRKLMISYIKDDILNHIKLDFKYHITGDVYIVSNDSLTYM